MAAPTQPQIEAVVTEPTYQVEYWNGSAWVAISDSLVADVSGVAEAAGGASGVAFGAESPATATIRFLPDASLPAWDGLRVRVGFGFSTSDVVIRVTGWVEGEDADDDAISWELGGIDVVIARTPVFSPLFFRRMASTKTTVSSVEDIASGSYAAGLINYICWSSGGRPYEQAASYPTAAFYYSCDDAIIAPEWSWVGGENAWDELGNLARAAGLIAYQDADGVLRVKNALNLSGAATYTFNVAAVDKIRRSARRAEKVASVRCSYTARALQPSQVIYEDTTPRLVTPLGSTQFTLEMSQPIYRYEVGSGGILPADTITGCTTEGQPLTAVATVVSSGAMRLTIQIANGTSDVMIVSRLLIRGLPIAPVEEGIAVYGSGTPEREISSEVGVYVQTRRHAERLVRLYADYYGTARPTYELSDLPYDPDRYVGEPVYLTYAPWSLSALLCRITRIAHQDTGALMSISLVPLTGVVTTADVFYWGGTYADGDTKTLSY